MLAALLQAGAAPVLFGAAALLDCRHRVLERADGSSALRGRRHGARGQRAGIGTLTGIFAASAVGPWLFGLTADHTSLSFAWAAVALMTLFAAAPVLWLRLSAPAPEPSSLNALQPHALAALNERA